MKDLKIKLVFQAAVLFFVFYLFSCSSAVKAYQGEAKPAKDIVHLIGNNNDLYLFRIDTDNWYNFQTGLNDKFGKLDVNFLPGEHDLEFRIGFSSKGIVKKVTFKAEAGKTYFVDKNNNQIIFYADKVSEANKIDIVQSELTGYKEPAGTEFARLKIEGDTAAMLKPLNVNFRVNIYRIDNQYSKLDGTCTFKDSFNSDLDNSLNIKLTPGEHKLICSVEGFKVGLIPGAITEEYRPIGTSEVTINVEAGKSYAFKVIKKIDLDTAKEGLALYKLEEVKP